MRDEFNEFNSNEENKKNTVRDQLAQLEAVLGEEEEDRGKTKQEDAPIQNRFEEKREEDVFKDPEKEKKKMDNKVKMGLIGFSATVVLLIVVVVFLQIKEKPTDISNTPSGSVDKITDTSTSSGTTKEEEDIKNKLEIPSDVKNVKEALAIFASNNEIVVSYFTEMKNEVIEYINRDRNDIYIEDAMNEYKKALLRDIEIFAKYKLIYENYDAADLYQVTLDRLQNAYDLARTAKNVMTEKALIENTNKKIGREEELNTRATTSFVTFLDNNEIEYTLEDNKIITE